MLGDNAGIQHKAANPLTWTQKAFIWLVTTCQWLQSGSTDTVSGLA